MVTKDGFAMAFKHGFTSSELELQSRTNYLEQSKDSEQNWAGPENFHVSFFVVSYSQYQSFCFLKEDWVLGSASTQFWDVLTISYKESTNQKNCKYGHFPRSAIFLRP